MTRLFLGGLLLAGIAADCSAALLDFSPATLPGGSRVERRWLQSGFQIDCGYMASTSAINTQSSSPSNGTDYLHFSQRSAESGPARIQKSDGAAFDVTSVDLSEYSTVFVQPTMIRFVGTKLDGTQVDVEFTTDGVIDGSGPAADFQTFSFPATFTALKYLEITTEIFAMDNLVVSPTAVLIETVSANGITTTSAVLRGLVNPMGSSGAVSFQLTPASGGEAQIITATESPLTASTKTAVSATVSGLQPHTAYTFYVKAENSEGTTRGDDATFTTLNSTPIANDDSGAYDGSATLSLEVLSNDSDADGDQLVIASFTQGMHGTVTKNGSALVYTPGETFFGSDSFQYAVADGFGGTATATVRIRSSIPISHLSLQGATGGKNRTAGDPVPGEPETTTFQTFGVPAINAAGRVAFLTSMATADGNVSAVFDGERIVARSGEAAPGLEATKLDKFSDPALNDVGTVAFLARLKGPAKNKSGEALYLARDGELTLALQMGSDVPAIKGAKLYAITAFQLLDEGLIFTGKLSGVRAGNSSVLCSWTPADGIQVLLQSGVDLEGKRIKQIAALLPAATSLGQGRTPNDAGLTPARVIFTDGSQAVVKVNTEGISLIAQSEGNAPVEGALWSSFGLPALNRTGDAAFLGNVKTGSGNAKQTKSQGLFAEIGGEPLALVASQGEIVNGWKLSAFSDPVFNDRGDMAATVTLLAGTAGTKMAKNSAILFLPKDGAPSLLASTGTDVAGVAGARWKSVESLALPNGVGPIFVATIAGRPREVSNANDRGLWALDSNGVLQLLVREGDELEADGSVKTVKSFTVLTLVPSSPGQTRAFDDTREVVYRAQFTDGSQAIVRVHIP